MATWTFLTNHAHVLVYVAKHPDATARDIADAVQITERSTQRIIADLEAEGYIARERVGRRNHYTLAEERPFRHPLNRAHHVGELIALLTDDET